jgi:phage recombination protein Bet
MTGEVEVVHPTGGPPAVLATDSERELVRATYAHDLDDSEWALFVAVCQAKRLSPLARQIYAQHRGKDRRLSIETTIDGFRMLAERTGVYGGQDAAQWCGPDGVWVDVWASDDPPYAARKAVWRTDVPRPTVAVARFDSYAARNSNGALQAVWASGPDLMIAKCAEALALRQAFPHDLSGLYTTDEMAQASNPARPQLRPDGSSVPAHLRPAAADPEIVRDLFAAIAKVDGRDPHALDDVRAWWSAARGPNLRRDGFTAIDALALRTLVDRSAARLELDVDELDEIPDQVHDDAPEAATNDTMRYDPADNTDTDDLGRPFE